MLRRIAALAAENVMWFASNPESCKMPGLGRKGVLLSVVSSIGRSRERRKRQGRLGSPTKSEPKPMFPFSASVRIALE